MKRNVVKKSESFSDWYTDVILNSKLADYAPVKGCMVIRPNGYGIWENVQRALDGMFKELGIENAYFPLFIPMSFLKKEQTHVEGFSPELAVVTHGGGEKLAEELAVRPTSETVMYDMYSKWVSSYRDLPILLNQWNNVVRWEKRTYFFLRTTEFLWQEGHTAHETQEEAMSMVLSALESYRKLYEDFLGIPVIKGIKSDAEKFAGAATTTTVEALMPDGKSLQAGTSHNLGQNFSKKEAFNISFSDKDGGTSYAWQTSFGLSTRAIGALVMVHGDDNGVVLPPRIAPTQVMLIPTDNSTEVSELCRNLEKELTNNSIRTKVLKDDSHTLGWRINECELTGIPLFAVIGQREVKSKEITFTQRFDGEKFTLSTGTSLDNILKSLENIHKGMFEKALKKQNELTFDVSDYEEFKKIMKTSKGFINAYWCESPECEKEIKDETKATTRCIRLEEVNSAKIKSGEGKCIRCQKACNHKWVFAQSY